MSKDLLVLADEYAAATATFARALALKDEADSMSPIAREAGDKRAVLAEALAALDTAQQEPSYTAIHSEHCFQPPYETSCKYGDSDCPASYKAQQAQPPAPDEAAREYMTGYSDGREWAGATNQTQPPAPDCRTCDRQEFCTTHHVYDDCLNGDQYQPAPAVVLWRTE